MKPTQTLFPLIFKIIMISLVLISCTPQTPAPLPTSQIVQTPATALPALISRIIYQVRPDGGGFIRKEFKADSIVQGNRASAQDPQNIYQEQTQITKAELDNIWEAAYHLWETPPEGDFLLPENGEGYVELTILTSDNRQLSIFWICDEQHPDARINALVDLLSVYRVGGE